MDNKANQSSRIRSLDNEGDRNEENIFFANWSLLEANWRLVIPRTPPRTSQ